MWISGDSLLTNLQGLENLDSINGDLYVGLNFFGGNPSLSSISELSNLEYIGGDLEIWNNPVLTSLQGLDNVNIDSLDALVIQDNTTLSTCEVQSICDYLDNPNVYAWISGNAPGCNSQEEVEAVCLEDVEEVGGRRLAVSGYPNPFNIVTTIEYELEGDGNITLAVFNYLGQEVAQIVNGRQSKGTHQVQWNAESIPAGIYFYELKADGMGQRSVGKLVKY